jgi:endonuclease YncB( thermonuclease family)
VSKKDLDPRTWVIAVITLIGCYCFFQGHQADVNSLRASTAVGEGVAAPKTYLLSNIRVIDADTIEADVTLPYLAPRIELPYNIAIPAYQGLVNLTKQSIRIEGVNAYEKNTPKGQQALKELSELVSASTYLLLQDTGGAGGRDKYGRILGDVILVFGPKSFTLNKTKYSGQIKVSEWILENNHGVPYAPR